MFNPRATHRFRSSYRTTRAMSAVVAATVVACVATPFACARAPRAGSAPGAAHPATALYTTWDASTPAPTLVVLIAIDQFRADYLDRFGSQFTGGLARLVRGGAVFTNAFHDHAITETAPGHSTMLSGRFPSSNGIVQNDEGVPDAQYPLVGATGPGASPFRFRGTVLIDWLRFRDQRSRGLSVSRKDRSAILPMGRAKQDVYWFSAGRFTTSTYYHDTLPTWVRRFNDRGIPGSLASKSWTLLLPASAYPEPDSVAVERGGRDMMFPHAMLPDPTRAAADVINFPWMDDITVAFALDGLEALKLGTGPATDVLSISLSSTDAVGHRYGPASRELHDQVLRVDRAIGVFLDSLYKLRDSTRVVIALTSDHGVTPLPETQPAGTQPAGQRVSLSALTTATRQQLQQKGIAATAFHYDAGVVYVDPQAFAVARVNMDSVGNAFAAAARAIPGISRVDSYQSLLAADTVRDAVARRWLHMFPPDVQVLLTVTLQPNSMWRSTDATHGSPSDADAQVPVIFYGRPFAPGRYADTVRVVDIAPTLAWVARIIPGERLDGRVLRRALR